MNFNETSTGIERVPFDDSGHQEEISLHLRWNFAAHAIEGGSYMAGMTFVSVETVLPALINLLGGPIWLVSLSSILLVVGVSVPSLFVAHALERLQWKKPIIVFFTIFQRLPFLVAGLCLLLLAESHPMLTLWTVALAPFASGFFCGCTYPAWLELVAKTIPGNRLSSLFAMRLIIAGVVGFFGGALIVSIISRWPGPTGFGVLHLLAFGFLVVSYVVFIFIKETNLPPRHMTEGLLDSLRDMAGILRDDRNFSIYLASRFFAAGAFVALPFMSLRALETLKTGESLLGYLVMALIAGSLAGNVFAGLLGDKMGAKLPATIATALYAAPFLIATFAASAPMFLLAFFLMGFCRDATNVATGALNAELPPIDKRMLYSSLIGASIAPSMLMASAVGTVAWSISGGFTLPAIIAACSLLISLVLTHKIDEPRHLKKNIA